MRLKTQRRAIYAAMGLTVISLIGGFAIASVQLGGSATSAQGTQSVTVTNIAGLTFDRAGINVSDGGMQSCVYGGIPCDIGAGNVTTCIGGVTGSTDCAAGEWVEQVTFSTVALTAMSPDNVTISGVYTVGGTPMQSQSVLDIIQNSDTHGHVLTIDFDLGSDTGVPGSITGINVVLNSA